MERRLKSLANHHGIHRVECLCEDGTWGPPKRGAQFRVTRPARGPNGKPKREQKFCRTLKEALAFRRGDDRASQRAMHSNSEKEGIRFSDLIDLWQKQKLPHLAITTQVKYRSYLKHFRFFETMIVDQIGPSEIDQWFAHIKTTDYLDASNPTRCSYDHEYTVLRSIFTFYRDRCDPRFVQPFRRDHAKMCIVRIQVKKVKDLSNDEFRRFVEHLEMICHRSGDPEIPFLVQLQYKTAARVQEAAALSIEDFDFDQRQISVRRRIQWVRRRGMPSIICEGLKAADCKRLPMDQTVIDLVRRAQLALGVREGFLFFRKGKPLSYRQIGYRYNQAFLSAGIDFRGTHIIRHAALTEVQEFYKDLPTTMAIAGHKDVKSTLRYTKVRESRIANALSALSLAPLAGEILGAGSQSVANHEHGIDVPKVSI